MERVPWIVPTGLIFSCGPSGSFKEGVPWMGIPVEGRIQTMANTAHSQPSPSSSEPMGSPGPRKHKPWPDQHVTFSLHGQPTACQSQSMSSGVHGRWAGHRLRWLLSWWKELGWLGLCSTWAVLAMAVGCDGPGVVWPSAGLHVSWAAQVFGDSSPGLAIGWAGYRLVWP
jgi:hypothetical protein